MKFDLGSLDHNSIILNNQKVNEEMKSDHRIVSVISLEESVWNNNKIN